MKNVLGSLQAVRLLVEVEIGQRAVLLVASATERDGAGFIARDLADALAASGKRVGLFDTGATEVGSVRTGSVANLDEAAFATALQSFDSDSSGHDMLIVLAPAFMSNARALSIASHAQGILFAVRSGRSITPEDRQMAPFLERLEIKKLGVVMTPAKSIQKMEERRAKENPAKSRAADSAVFSRTKA